MYSKYVMDGVEKKVGDIIVCIILMLCVNLPESGNKKLLNRRKISIHLWVNIFVRVIE